MLALAIALTVGICVSGATEAQAKSAPKISSKLVKLKKKKSKTIKVKGTKKKVKWSVSDPTIAKISRKGKTGVRIKAKKKAGACVVRGVVGKRTFWCLVMVNNSNAMSSKTKDWAKKGGFSKYIPKPPVMTPTAAPSKPSPSTPSKPTPSTPSKPTPSAPSDGGNVVMTETTTETTTPSAGTGTNPPGTGTVTPPEPQTEAPKPEPEKPKYDYSVKLVNPTPVCTIGDYNDAGALIKITTNNPNMKGERYAQLRVDGEICDTMFLTFDDVSRNGFEIAQVPFTRAGIHRIDVLESYRISGKPRTYLETGASVTFEVKDSGSERSSWIRSLIARNRKATDKETLEATCRYLASNLHYHEYIADANGNIVRRAALLRHYGDPMYGWDCWATTELMIEIAKTLNPTLTGRYGMMAGNDPEVDWHRFAWIKFPDGSEEAYDACPPQAEFYQVGSIEMTM